MKILIGVFFVALLSIFATYISTFSFISSFGISPLIIGILLGIVYANTIKNKFSKQLQSGIIFSTKFILRFGIVLYGFRLTFQNIQDVGFNGVLISFLIVSLTFIIGYLLGTKVFKLDKELTILISAGSSICGAAAILATESVIKSKAYKSTIAVSTVVVFGTISMFLYPFLYKSGILELNVQDMGIYIGASLHEVAHVVGASNVLTVETSSNAIIVKMIRVMMLAPFLIVLSLWLLKTSTNINSEKTKIIIPWFAVLFIVVVAFNSFDFLSTQTIFFINSIDTFALTMAMTALGMETSIAKFKELGLKPIYLAFVLFIWLIFGGYFLVKFFS